MHTRSGRSSNAPAVLFLADNINILNEGPRCRLARARAERGARGEGAGAHAEARAERRGDVAEVVAAAGAVAVVGSGYGDIGAHPLAAGFAKRIDALHGETGQVLHGFSLSVRKRRSIHARPDRHCVKRNQSSPSWPNPASCYADCGKSRFRCKIQKFDRAAPGTKQLMTRILAREGCGVKKKDYKILW